MEGFPSEGIKLILNSTETRGTKVRVQNIHYDLTEEDLDVSPL